ncbi:MAG: hypothetical protein CMJ93_05225 [Planctomycetes bacterium]|nr:hypothetical protein [Planctomycetota bacterium]
MKWLIGLAIVLGGSVLATTDVFIKKTIVMPESAWVMADVEADDQYLGDRFSSALAKKIKQMKRFDAVQLDPDVFEPVYTAMQSPTANTTVLMDTLKIHVMDAVEALLMSDAYQKRRVRAIQHHRGVSFARTKGKSEAYTLDEMRMLMNSVYLYMPYIHSAVTTTDEGENPATLRTITGGVIWYNVQMGPTGNVQLVQVDAIERSSFMVLPTAMAIKSLMDVGIMRSLVSKALKATKSMPMFTLISKTTSVADRDYTLSLTKDSGAKLDDLFFLQEDMENETGDIERKTVGLLRIRQSSRDDWAHGYQHIGSVRDRGGYVIESPRRGFQIAGGIHHASGIKSAQILKYRDNQQIVDLPFQTASGWTASLDYNVGRHIGISQLFLGVDYSGSTLASDVGTVSGHDNHMQTYHTRLSKKFWWQRHALRLDISTGTEWVRLTNTPRVWDYALKFRSMTYGIGYELMLGSRWLLSASATQHRMYRLSHLSYKLDGVSHQYSHADARNLGIQYNSGYTAYRVGLRLDF